MPVKPNGALCSIREQIVEDLASGLTLLIECDAGRTRLVIAGKSLPFGNREIIFDRDGKEAAAGTLVGSFRRPSWLKGVKERVGERDTQAIQYTVKEKAKDPSFPAKKLDVLSMKVWLDTTTNLPVKLAMTGGDSHFNAITETHGPAVVHQLLLVP